MDKAYMKQLGLRNLSSTSIEIDLWSPYHHSESVNLYQASLPLSPLLVTFLFSLHIYLMNIDQFFRQYSVLIAEEWRTILPRVEKCGVNSNSHEKYGPKLNVIDSLNFTF
jgi:hypothetical protein